MLCATILSCMFLNVYGGHDGCTCIEVGCFELKFVFSQMVLFKANSLVCFMQLSKWYGPKAFMFVMMPKLCLFLIQLAACH